MMALSSKVGAPLGLTFMTIECEDVRFMSLTNFQEIQDGNTKEVVIYRKKDMQDVYNGLRIWDLPRQLRIVHLNWEPKMFMQEIYCSCKFLVHHQYDV